MASPKLKAPFPWFGGKSRVSDIVWERFGDVPNYVEPFFGSGAVLLARPHAPRIETVNDIDCFVANFWRAVREAPALVAEWADWPVNEADLHARHLWLVNREEFRERMKSDPDYFDAKIAGWWVWGISCWIGSGWCARPEWTGRICGFGGRSKGVHADVDDTHRAGFEHTRPNLQPQGVHAGERNARVAGQNVWRKRPNLGDPGKGIQRTYQKRPELRHRGGGVVSRQLPHLSGDAGAAGSGIHSSARRIALIEWMERLADRLRHVRICCGKWDRILGPAPTTCIGKTAVFLDPPYSAPDRDAVYNADDFGVAQNVKLWAIENGENPDLRIALCGYESEHDMPAGWLCFAWKANGGYSNVSNAQGKINAKRERIWFSPHCLAPASPELFATV
jgi:site-specific DNA-adenine methylase